jgi:molybdopterin synthase sulfur carrier subunit
MKLTVLYFAWVKEKVGLGEETVDVPSGIATVADLMDWLSARTPGHAAALSNRKLVKAAVNQTHAPLTSQLDGATEVAFFPPVTGG